MMRGDLFPSRSLFNMGFTNEVFQISAFDLERFTYNTYSRGIMNMVPVKTFMVYYVG